MQFPEIFSRAHSRRNFILSFFPASVAVASWQGAPPSLTLPGKSNSVRFAMIGDMGTGKRPQYEVAAQMLRYRQIFPFEFVITLGDNIYGDQDAAGLKLKFEDPYRALLEGKVTFYAALGNHDNQNQRLYKPFNMDGKRYYSFKKGKAEFFVLDSNYMDREQIAWLGAQLQESTAPWKICYCHHPMYSHAKFHGSDTDLRRTLEPICLRYGVQVVFAGHEHVYERLKPQHGINHFVLGNSGQLRPHYLRPSPDTAKGFDTDQTFGLVEIVDDDMFFQIVSRTGESVDSGVIHRQAKSTETGSARVGPAGNHAILESAQWPGDSFLISSHS